MKISINYSKLESEGNKLMNLAEQLDSIVDDLDDNISKLNTCFVTSNTSTITNSLGQIKEKMIYDKKNIQLFGGLMILAKDDFKLDEEEYAELLKKDDITVKDIIDINE